MFWFYDDGSIAAVIYLTTSVRMIEVASVRVCLPPICERIVGLNRTLCKTRDTISPGSVGLMYSYRKLGLLEHLQERLTVGMYCSVKWQLVDDGYIGPFALIEFDKRSREFSVNENHVPFKAIWRPLRPR